MRAKMARSGSSLDPDVAAYLAAMTVQPDAARITMITDLIVGLKDAGIWSILDGLVIPAGHHHSLRVIDARRPGATLTYVSGSSTSNFQVDQGMNGSIVDTGFNPSVASPSWSLTSASLIAWIGAATSDTHNSGSLHDPVFGNSLGISSINLDVWRGSSSAGNANVAINGGSNNNGGGTGVQTRLGFTAAVRRNNDYHIWKGAVKGVVDPHPPSGVPNANLLLGASGAVANVKDWLSILAWGGGLTDVQIADIRTLFANYMGAL